MSSLKSGALLSLFTGVTFGAMQRPAHIVKDRHYDAYPSPHDAKAAERASTIPGDPTSLVALALTSIAA